MTNRRKIIDPFDPEARAQLWPNESRGWSGSDPYISAERAQEIARQHAYAGATHTRTDVDSAEVEDARQLNLAAAELSERAPQFGPAWSACLGGMPVVALSPGGAEVVGEPMRDLRDLINYWSDHPDSPAGLPTGPEYDFVAVSFDDAGYKRMVDLASPIPASREDADFGYARGRLDHGGAPITLVEQRPGTVLRTAYAYNVNPEESAKAAEWATSARVEVRSWALAWRWPIGSWTRLEPKRVARGTVVLAGIPLGGSVLEGGGKQWVVQASSPSRWINCPPWVCADVLGAKERQPA
jgi:hypothetical protein